MSVKDAVKGALQGVLKGELQGAIRKQSVLLRLFQGALKGPPN